MPRNQSGVYSVPLGTKAVPNTTIQSTPYNNLLDDLVADNNGARPVTAGGTGGNSKETAQASLGIPSAAALDALSRSAMAYALAF